MNCTRQWIVDDIGLLHLNSDEISLLYRNLTCEYFKVKKKLVQITRKLIWGVGIR